MLRPYNRGLEMGECGIPQEIALYELDAVREGVTGGVAPGDGQSRGRNVCRDDARAGKLLGKSDGDAARAGADVDDAQTIAGESSLATSANFSNGEAVQSDFDNVFGFRAGNQHVGSDFKFQAPEFLFPGDILRGFAFGAPENERQESMRVEAGDHFFRMSVKPGAVAAEYVQEQQLRCERVRGDVRVTKLGDASFECRAYVDHFRICLIRSQELASEKQREKITQSFAEKTRRTLELGGS